MKRKVLEVCNQISQSLIDQQHYEESTPHSIKLSKNVEMREVYCGVLLQSSTELLQEALPSDRVVAQLV